MSFLVLDLCSRPDFLKHHNVYIIYVIANRIVCDTCLLTTTSHLSVNLLFWKRNWCMTTNDRCLCLQMLKNLWKTQTNVCPSLFVHLHEIEGLYFHYILFVWVCVCMWVSLSVCQWTKFLRNVFAKWLLIARAQTLLKLITFASRLQWVSDAISIILQYSLLTSLLWISTLLCPIKMKFDVSLRYVRFTFEFDKNQMGYDVAVTSFKFLQTIVDIFTKKYISIEPTNCILGTNIQHHKVHLIIRVQETLTGDEGQK